MALENRRGESKTCGDSLSCQEICLSVFKMFRVSCLVYYGRGIMFPLNLTTVYLDSVVKYIKYYQNMLSIFKVISEGQVFMGTSI